MNRAYARATTPSGRATITSRLRVATAIVTGNGRSAQWSEVLAHPWHHLTVEDAAEFRRAVYRRFVPQSTRNDTISAVRRVVTECYRARLISALRRDLLMEELYTVAPGESTRRRRLTGDELADLMAACDRIGDARTTARNTSIVALFRTTGLRISELVAIDLADWDREDASILLRSTKNGRDHRIFLSPATDALLRRWLTHRGEAPGALFTALNRAEHDPLHPFSVRYMLKTRARAAGIAPFGAHDFRRTFATDLLERYDAALVSKLLNHKKLDSTLIYDLRGDTAKRDAVRALDLAMPEPEPQPEPEPASTPERDEGAAGAAGDDATGEAA